MSQPQHAEQPAVSRFVVGLDLGTTNSAMAYVDTIERPRTIRTFVIPQIVAPGQIESRETLPSFYYQTAPGEFPPNSLSLPWSDHQTEIVGQFARDHGTLVPGRLIASAKSWLCHNGVDRTADLLPWQGADDVTRLSPVTVSARYIQHVREAWDARFQDHPLAQQDFVLTLPASFDEVARELTIKAARQAGLPRVVLIEEPQAAFYAWIDKHAEHWSELVTPGQNILVCDVGGGTSDFTLIRVQGKPDGTIQFHRVAVGEHLILGGDNLDLALAHHLEERVRPGGQLDPRQWGVLVRSCRHLKEVLLGENPPEQTTMTLPGSGSKLIGGSIQIRVTRAEVETLLVDGFFPQVPFDEKPATVQAGFQEFGLPYAPDPAITKYLAAFLNAHRREMTQDLPGAETSSSSAGANDRLPVVDLLLFNGGVFASPKLRESLIRCLESWFRPQQAEWSPIVLENERLDLAVARGAAYYGMVRRGEGVRIAAGLARTYYIGVEQTAGEAAQTSALCLVPAGLEPGQEVDLTQRQFQLLVSQPIEFPIFVSSTRLTDRAGDLIPFDSEQMKTLPPIRTVLKTGKSKEAATIDVILKARLTEIGTLDLWCSEAQGKRSWKLLFDVRSATQTDIAAHDATGESQGVFDESLAQSASAIIAETFSRTPSTDTPGTESRPTNSPAGPVDAGRTPATVVKLLENELGMSRSEWPTTILRELWSVLLDCESGRWISAAHEARWLNLTGFTLRPGYGLAVDDWRCHETWKRLEGKLAFDTTACRAEWYILWRRVAGGLTSGQQQALAAPLVSQFKLALRQAGGKGKGADFGSNPHESAELLRLLGSCELLSIAIKQDLGELLLEVLRRPRFAALGDAALWALGRLGARKLVYGPLNLVIPPTLVAQWLATLAPAKRTEPLFAFTLMQLARRTGDRYRDVDDTTRTSVLQALKRLPGATHFQRLVTDVTTLESEDQALIFGESLPKGLKIL